MTTTTSIHETLQSILGATAKIQHQVRSQDTADQWGNNLPVLATPILLWLSEIACMRVTQDTLAHSGWMTVGAHHDSGHIAPTCREEMITLTATLTKVTERSLTFDVHAYDSRGEILRGTHRRGLVRISRFIERIDSIRSSSHHQEDSPVDSGNG
ncbi:thioesterase family protein [Frankia sp. CiP3]|uniref:thioesterase family protein n=1 Tax=Frankia sp. CiP3 TaxID=2880971 RepID=UPI0035B0A9A7